MKYFLDTEFIEDGRTIDLISIGVAAEDGREFYALNVDCDWTRASEWVKENVLKHLPRKPSDFEFDAVSSEQGWARHSNIGSMIHHFVGGEIELTTPVPHGKNLMSSSALLVIPEGQPKPEFWAYYADYDHVALCQLFGPMMKLPKGFPMYTKDLKQTIDELRLSIVQEQSSHNALEDARWVRSTYLHLRQNYKHPALTIDVPEWVKE